VLRQVGAGVLVHTSDFLESNAVVVQGRQGVLLIDPGIRGDEIACLVDDLAVLGQPVVAGFATHPHWDHVLWDARFGSVPRYGTAACAADIQGVMSDSSWMDRVADVLPPDIADQIPLDGFGQITPLPVDAQRIPWDGPEVRIFEHSAHAVGHAALLIEDARVLVAGDMLSDILIPFLDLDASDPIDDYLAALDLFEGAADAVDVVVPGHGSVGGAGELRARIELDRAYLHALRDGGGGDDSRLDPTGPNAEFLPGVHEWQAQQIAGVGSGRG
jgi:glyoxylase-like metal-dependent hydrolase (beta-lactamase superfamily II)